MTPRVVILGNGFDLNLGLKTSYIDFLHSIEFEKIHRSHNNFIVDRLINNYNLCNWIDIENELRKIAIEYNNSDSSYHNSLKFCYHELTDALKNYLIRASILFDGAKLDENTPAAKFLRVMSNYPKDFTVFSFNYTNLPLLAKRIGLNTCPLCFHVHGSLKKDNIILGFEDDVDNVDRFSYMIKTFNPYYSSSHIRHEMDNAKEIIIFGHSMGNTDYHYFSNLFTKLSSNNNKKPISLSIITGTENARIDILNNLRAMNSHRTNYLFDQNNVSLYTSCVYSSQFHLHSLFRRLEIESKLSQSIEELQSS